MIERKRRNEFVRKREFDMLRRVRREGLIAEQAAALTAASRLDDSERLRPTASRPARRDGVKAKIDAIEQQMVGSSHCRTWTHAPHAPRRVVNAPTLSRRRCCAVATIRTRCRARRARSARQRADRSQSRPTLPPPPAWSRVQFRC